MRNRVIFVLLIAMAIASTISIASAQTSKSGSSERIDKYPASCDGFPAKHHVKRGKHLVSRGYRLARIPDKTPMKGSEKRAMRKHKFCIQHDGLRDRISDHRAKKSERYKKALREYARQLAAERRMSRYTPYDCGSHGDFAIPCYIIACESHYNWYAYNPSGAVGPYQLLGKGAPHPADTYAERLEHHRIAYNLWAGGAGASHWVCA